jgi:outer membrane scaffolding protein for murein synthesis (MipA/OmpV family)
VRRLHWLAAALGFGSAAVQASFLDGLNDLASNQHRWEGAIGATINESPAYLGASDYGFGAKPALFLRYGRFSLTTGAGFTTRRADQVERGLGADLVLDPNIKVTLSGRIDGGRKDSDSPALAGLGDIDRTLRARLSATWRPAEGWLFNTAASVDVLGRGGGTVGEVSFAREVPVGLASVWSWGGSVTMADSRYMQTYYGVTPQQSQNSGYAVYSPGAGLRDVALSTGLRSDFARDWVGFVNIGVSRALGPVLDSPLTFKPLGFGINAGLAWRF